MLACMTCCNCKPTGTKEGMAAMGHGLRVSAKPQPPIAVRMCHHMIWSTPHSVAALSMQRGKLRMTYLMMWHAGISGNNKWART